MRCAFLYVLLCLGALSLIGCRTLSRRPLAELVPANSFAMLSVNWSAVNKDDRLKRMVKGVEIEKIFRELSISSNNVAEVAIFSDLQSSSGATSGIIMRGSYRIRTVVDSLKAQGWHERIYHRYKVYSKAAEDKWLAPLNSGALVLGTKAGIEGAINAEINPRESFASTQSYRQLKSGFNANRPPIQMIVAIPTALQDMASTALQFSSAILDFAGVGALGWLLDKIGYLRGFGCSISRNGSSFPVEMVAIMKNEEAASFVSGSLNLLKELALAAPKGNMSQSDVENAQAIRNMSVTRVHDSLQIKVVLAEKDLGDI